MSKRAWKLTANQGRFTASDWWMEVTDTVGRGKCQRLFSVKERTIYRWESDGKTSQRSASVLEKMRELFDTLVAMDRIDLVASAITYFDEVIEQAMPGIGVVPLAKTMHEEICRDYQAVSRLADAIANKEPVAVVRSWAQAANEEINRSVAKYEQEQTR